MNCFNYVKISFKGYIEDSRAVPFIYFPVYVQLKGGLIW